jgi:hypothetical protein
MMRDRPVGCDDGSHAKRQCKRDQRRQRTIVKNLSQACSILKIECNERWDLIDNCFLEALEARVPVYRMITFVQDWLAKVTRLSNDQVLSHRMVLPTMPITVKMEQQLGTSYPRSSAEVALKNAKKKTAADMVLAQRYLIASKLVADGLHDAIALTDLVSAALAASPVDEGIPLPFTIVDAVSPTCELQLLTDDNSRLLTVVGNDGGGGGGGWLTPIVDEMLNDVIGGVTRRLNITMPKPLSFIVLGYLLGPKGEAAFQRTAAR